MSAKEWTIYLADDHELVAKGVKSLLLQMSEVRDVQLFKNGRDLFAAVLQNTPTVIFLDIEMPIWNGIDTLKEFQRQKVDVPVIVLSMLEDKTVIESCWNLGARGFMHKDCDTEELQKAIETVLNGNRFVSNYAKELLSTSTKNFSSKDIQIDSISGREMDVLRLLCDGYSSQEISDKLFLSRRTVETHKNNLMKKFDVNSAVKVVSIVLKNRIVN